MNYPEIPGYTIQRRLGSGGMASVYLAIQDTFGRQVALKVMAQHLAPDPSFGARFLREARIVAQMSHRNFVPVFDVGQHGDLHYMSMEYLPNGDLRTLMQQGLPLTDALQIISDVASGLHYAASKNFVHRDIKPENILFREDNSPVITDFGIARDTQSVTQMTVVGTVMGTPHYMSPEQARAEEIDGRSDLYNLGIILYELLSGEVPYDAPSALATSIKHINDPIPLLPPHLACFQPFIDRALAKNPDERFQTGEEMIAAIDALESVEQTLIEQTRVKCRTEREESIGTLLEAPATRVMSSSDRDGQDGQVTTPVPRRRRRQTSETMRADPSDAQGRETTLVKKPSKTPSLLLLFLAVAAGGGAYYWHTYLRDPGAESPAATVTQPRPARPVEPAVTPATSTATPPTEAVAAQREDTIELLLQGAETDIEAYRLSSPAGNNAVEKYRRIIALSPDSSAAAAGLEKVATRYAHMAQTAISDNRLEEAERYLAQAEQLGPDNPTVLQSLSALEAALEATPTPDDLTDTNATPANPPGMEPLPELPVEDLLLMATELGGPDAIDSGNFRKLGQIYQAVLEADPENDAALAGLENSSRYAGEFVDNSLLVGQLDLAAAQIGYLQEIDPDNARIAPLQASLDELQQAETAKLHNEAQDELLRAIVSEEGDADELLATADRTLNEPYPIGGTAADFRLLGDALKPTHYRIESARRQAPDDPRIPELSDHLSRRYTDLARELIELGDLQSARSLLDEATSFNASSPGQEALRALLDSMESGTVLPAEKTIIEQIY